MSIYTKVETSEKFTIWCPCRTCSGACRCCCKSCCSICSTILCRPCIPSKAQTWNRRYEVAATVMHNAFYGVAEYPGIWSGRLFLDNDIPTWSPVLPRGVAVRQGEHLGGNPALPSYECIYDRNQGSGSPPSFLFPDAIASMEQEQEKGRTYIMYFHGGGFVFGNHGTHRLLLYTMAKRTGATILSIGYRRAPEFPHPTPHMDCVDAYRWLQARVGAHRIFLAGDSAGGALVIETLVAARDSGLSLPVGGILLSPWVDLFEEESESIRRNAQYDFLPPHLLSTVASLYTKNEGVSAINQDLHDLPPLLVEYGGFEIFRDQIARFVAVAQEAGVRVTANEYPEMIHVFQLLSLSSAPSINESFEAIRMFMERRVVELAVETAETGAHASDPAPSTSPSATPSLPLSSSSAAPKCEEAIDKTAPVLTQLVPNPVQQSK